MGINSVNYAVSANSYGAYTQKLTEETKAKLEKLGIPYTSTTTEAQAQAMIQSELKTKKNREENLEDNKQQSQTNNKNNLFEKAVELAKKIGITVDKNTSFEELIIKIEDNLEAKISQSQNNKSLLKQLKQYSEELANIQAQSQGSTSTNNTNQALMMSLEMLSNYNKNYFINH